MTAPAAAKLEAGLINSTLSADEAEAGTEEMSEGYRAGGNELYVGAGGREHD